MKAVYKRELRSFFTSVIGWIFLAAFCFVFGLYFVANNLSYASPYLSYSLGSALFIFIIIIPILTMRTMAEDRRAKTDQLLFTSPVPVVKIIIGKYLSVVTILSIALGGVCITPVILSRFGTVPMRENYLLILGVWLYGCLSIAICVFLSSITESQVIAAVLSFAVLFVGYMMESIASLISSTDNVVTNVVSALSTVASVDNFANALFDVPGLIYYVSGIILFLFLTCQVVQKHRWSVSAKKIRRGVYNSGLVVIAIAIVVVVNVLGYQLPDSVKNIDLSSNSLYSLTDDTYEVLDELEDDVTIYALSSESDMDETLGKTLDRYEEGTSHITIEYVDMAESPTFYTNYTDEAPSEMSLIVECGDNYKLIDYEDIYEYEVDYTTYSYTTTGYDGEGQITSALVYLTSENLPVVYTITGHDETDVDSYFTDSLEKMNATIESLTLLEVDAVPDDAQAIIINGPTSDFSEDDAQKVIDYLADGGKALITTSFEATDDLENFNTILEAYGMEVDNGLVVETDTSMYYQYAYYLLPTVQSADETEDIDSYIFAPFMQPITYTQEDSEDLTYTSLLSSSDSAYVKLDVANSDTLEQEADDETGEFDVAGKVTDSTTGAEVTVVTSTYIFTEDADSMVSGQNLALFKGIAEQLLTEAEDTSTDEDSDEESEEESGVVSIDVKSLTTDSLTVSQFAVILGEIIVVIAIPLVLIILGVFIWIRRRRV